MSPGRLTIIQKVEVTNVAIVQPLQEATVMIVMIVLEIDRQMRVRK